MRAIRAVALAAITPRLEKNAIKTVAVDVPLVFSMSRVVVLASATGMVRHEWFHDPRCSNGYTWLRLDDGRVVELADPGMRTPHAGPCLTPLANSRFYGIAAATNGSVCVSAKKFSSIV